MSYKRLTNLSQNQDHCGNSDSECDERPSKMTADLDSILIEIGEFGKYQAFTYILICLPVFFSAANSLTYVFTAGVPTYRCFVPGCDNETHPQYTEGWLQMAIPPGDSEAGKYKPAQCQVYKRNTSLVDSCESDDFLRDQQERCHKWVWHPDENTIVNEWEITCLDNQWKLSLVGSVHFAGILVGSLIFGYLADRFGRKIVLVFSLVTMSITGIMQAISPDYITFQVFVFLNAIATAGVYPLAFILGVEMVGPNKREMSSIVINYFYAVGEASIGLVAWLSGDWKIIQLAVSVPPAIFILYYWFVPESVRWLLSQRENGKARRILNHAAKTNGVVISERLLATLNDNNDGEKESSQSFVMTVKQLCKSRRLVLRSANLFFIWAANAFVFYGLSVNSTSLGGNKYVNFITVCLAEIPGYTLAWILLKRGRRLALSGTMLLCAVTCLAAAFVSEESEWGVLALYLFGKIGITGSFAIVYVYTAELYPTPMRSASTGVCSMMARFGAMIAPYAPLLGVYSAPLPMLLFGGVSLAAGLLSLILPETLGIHLPDTVRDAEGI